MKQRAFDPQKIQSLFPAKKVTVDEIAIKEIILYRIKNGFYDQKIVKAKVVEKLMFDLSEIPPHN